jgi:hypothetical protein
LDKRFICECDLPSWVRRPGNLAQEITESANRRRVHPKVICAGNHLLSWRSRKLEPHTKRSGSRLSTRKRLM